MKLKSPAGEIIDIDDDHTAEQLQSPAHGFVRVPDDVTVAPRRGRPPSLKNKD